MSLWTTAPRALFFGLLIFSSGDAVCQCPGGVRSFLRYEGTWTLQLDADDADRGIKPPPKLIDNHCRLQGSFVTCHQTVDGTAKMLVAYKPTSKPCEFTSVQIPDGGNETSSGLVGIAGSVWTYPWTSELRGHLVHFRVRNIFANSRRKEHKRERT